jgi:glycosyltransferase involved in cell wall biosynthesis
MLLLDLTHTSHTPARTGIQRVTRALHQHLHGIAEPVTRDPFLGGWRKLEKWELAGLQESQGAGGRFEWPQRVKWQGRIQRALGPTHKRALSGTFTGLIEAEFFSSNVARDFDKLFAHVTGPRVVVFHDALALKLPELVPAATVARFPAYMKELLLFDGIAANSVDSRDALVSYWKWLGLSDTPPVVAIPLGVDLPKNTSAGIEKPGPSPVILTVSTLEGRKNHLSLLSACESLWQQGAKFELHLVGHFDPSTGQKAFDRIRALQAEGHPLRYDGPVTDEVINAAYERCTFTVLPSFAEGFGLPAIESLIRGKPCICSGNGALGEISQQGGCVPLPKVDAATLAAAIGRLLNHPAEIAALRTAALSRSFKSWAQYATEITDWLGTLPRRR